MNMKIENIGLWWLPFNLTDDGKTYLSGSQGLELDFGDRAFKILPCYFDEIESAINMAKKNNKDPALATKIMEAQELLRREGLL